MINICAANFSCFGRHRQALELEFLGMSAIIGFLFQMLAEDRLNAIAQVLRVKQRKAR